MTDLKIKGGEDLLISAYYVGFPAQLIAKNSAQKFFNRSPI